MISSFPLQWPEGYARTLRGDRTWSQWKQTLAKSRDYLQDEIRRMGAVDLVISSNVPLKQNGELRGDWQRFKEEDTGVAVYFKWKSRDYVMCCDKYRTIWENVYAIGRTINALRQIDRDGVSEFLERAFTGFPGLPAPGESTAFNYWTVLDIAPTKDLQAIADAYIRQAKIKHPNAGGTNEDFLELQQAKRLAEQEAAANG